MQPMTRLFSLILTVICFQVHRQKYLDNSVNTIKLRDPKTVEKTFGEDVNYLDKDSDQTEVANIDGKQILTMIFHPGGTINEFSEFKVSYNSKNSKPKLKIETKDFETAKKVKLGLTEKQVKKLLGPPTKRTTDNGLEIWTYESKTEDDLYFGRYDFKDGRLIQFWFGEEYP